MKLNKQRPYGTVFGHDTAVFEQDGLLFDGAGEPLGGEQSRVPVKESAVASKTQAKIASARAFLENILSGGALDKSVIFKEAENNNQHWGDVKTAFAQMEGKTFKRGAVTLWHISTERVDAK